MTQYTTVVTLQPGYCMILSDVVNYNQDCNLRDGLDVWNFTQGALNSPWYIRGYTIGIPTDLYKVICNSMLIPSVTIMMFRYKYPLVENSIRFS